MKSIKFLTIFIFVLLTMISCTGSKDSIKFKEAYHYFYRNDAPQGEQLLRLQSQKELDNYFGSATVMGKDGAPTSINFDKYFVIAKVLPETNHATEINNIKLTHDNNRIILGYKTKTHGMTSQDYNIRPTVLLLVNRKYIGSEITEKR
ncbi:hypothetical protein [Segatella albensis]|uniref:hypothetical protein n=1 Tax=Segatella albensis TaxID=77768 RepID=UPI00040FE0FE|nr:hypothetical protein [Segatella albensis]